MNDIEDEVPSRQNSSRLEEDIFLDDDPEGGEGFEDNDDNPTALESGTETVLFDTGGQEEEFAVFPAEESNDEYVAGGEGDDAAPLRESGEENYAERNHHEPGDGARSPPEAWRAYLDKEEEVFVTKFAIAKVKVSGLLKLCIMPRSENGGSSHQDDPRWDDVRRFLREATDEEKKLAAAEVTERGRFPLYLACACRPPADVVESLLEASPQTVQCGNDGGMTPLHAACSEGASEEVVRLLIDRGGGKDACMAQTEDGRTPLHFACWTGPPEEVVRLLIDGGGGKEACMAQAENGWTPLHYACSFGASDAVVRLLIDGGGGKDACMAQEEDGLTPLHYACSNGASEAIVRLLINGGGENACLAQNENGSTPLHKACQHGASEAVVRLLIDGGGGKEVCLVQMEDGWTPLHFAIQEGASEHIVRLLIDGGGGEEACLAQEENGYTPLHFACSKGASEAIVRLLVDGGGGKEVCLAQTEKGWTPLHFACQHGASKEVVRLLIDGGGGKETCLAEAENGWTPLHFACSNGASEGVVCLLIEGGGGKDARMARNEGGYTPLHLACQHRASEEVVRLLVNGGGGKEACMVQTKKGATPLHVACHEGASEEVVRLLIDRGGGKQACLAQAKNGWTPLHVACQMGASEEVVRLLIDGGGGKEVCLARTEGGNTPLHIACNNGASEEVVRLLIDGGGGKEGCLAQEEDGWTPLHFACREGAPEQIVRLLIDVGGGKEACLIKAEDGSTPLHTACYYGHSEENIGLIVQHGGGMSCKTRDKTGHRFPLYYALGYERIEDAANKERVSEDCLRLIIKHGGAAPLRDLLDVSQKDRDMCLSFEETREALNEGFTRRPVLAIMMLDLYFQGFLVAVMSLATKQSLEQNGGLYTWQLLLLILAVSWFSIREIMQMAVSSYQAYVTDFWNWLDISQIILVSASVAMMNSSQAIAPDTSGRVLLTITVGIVWLALLGVMKNFLYGIAVFVSSLQQIVMELIPFLVVTAVTLSAFVFMFYSANINASYCESEDLEEKWYCGMTGKLFAQLSSFVLTGLEIEVDIIEESGTTAAILYAFGIVIALIFLNVLIAKISNVFSDVEKSGNEVFWRNRLSAVAETESLLHSLKDVFGEIRRQPKKRTEFKKTSGFGKVILFVDNLKLNNEEDKDVSEGDRSVRGLILRPRRWDHKKFSDDRVAFLRQELLRMCSRLFVPILLLISFAVGLATCGVLWPKWMTKWLFFGKENVDVSVIDTLNVEMGERMTGMESKIIESEEKINQLGERMSNIEENMKGMNNKLDNLLEAVVKLNEQSFSVRI